MTQPPIFKIRSGKDIYDLWSTPDTTIFKFMEEIRDLTGIFPSKQKISYGIPQKELPCDSKSLYLRLRDVGITRRTMFILTKKTDQEAPIHMKSNLIEAIKYPISPDNSCLFNSIGYLCTGNDNNANELRKYVIQQIKNNRDVYTPATLGCEVDEYCKWIADPKHWGGYIEINILSKRFNVEICILYIEEQNIVPINGCNADKRIYIIYDGIHYDAIVFKAFGVPDKRIVDKNDENAFNLAMKMLGLLKYQFTNVKKDSLKCDQCGKLFKGAQEAETHFKNTGHINFSQVKPSS